MSSPFGQRIQYKQRPQVTQTDVSVPTTSTSDDPVERRRIAFEKTEADRLAKTQAANTSNTSNMFRKVDTSAILAKDAEVEAIRKANLANLKPNKGQIQFGDTRVANGYGTGGRRVRKSRKSKKSRKARKSRKSRKSRR